METFNKMRINERFKLLHDWFPQEIPGLLDHILFIAKELRLNKEKYSYKWKLEEFPFSVWLVFAKTAEDVVISNIEILIDRSDVFSDALSDESILLFIRYCFKNYADEGNENEKFILAEKLLIQEFDS